MEQLIDFINEDLEIKGISLVKRAKLQKVKQKATELLEEEKKQIVHAFSAGQIDICKVVQQEAKEMIKLEIPIPPEDDHEDGEEYFNQKFNK